MFRGLPNDCALVYRGSVPLGMACEATDECAPDARGFVECDLLTDVCTVQIRGKLGEACHDSCELKTDIAMCAHVVDPTEAAVVSCREEDGLVCAVNGTCQPSLGLGCKCLGNEYCNGQTFCDDDAMTCLPRAHAGSPCSLNKHCIVDNYCDRDAEVCKPRMHANEPCAAHDQCYAGLCRLDICSLDNEDSRGNFHDIFCDGVGTD